MDHPSNGEQSEYETGLSVRAFNRGGKKVLVLFIEHNLRLERTTWEPVTKTRR